MSAVFPSLWISNFAFPGGEPPIPMLPVEPWSVKSSRPNCPRVTVLSAFASITGKPEILFAENRTSDKSMAFKL